MTLRWEYRLVCDICGYVASSWTDADDHEATELDHWVQMQQIQEVDHAD